MSLATSTARRLRFNRMFFNFVIDSFYAIDLIKISFDGDIINSYCP